MRANFLLFVFLSFFLLLNEAFALVKYDEGRLTIKGVVLLQDSSNPLHYYYIPQYPRLSSKGDGTLEFVCLKYIGENNQAGGGLFHALIEFSLPQEVVDDLEKELRKQISGARVMGPVPMNQAFEEGSEGVGNFEIVSTILSNRGEESEFSKSVIKSGHAPLLPGSKAVIAAQLTQQGATSLWNSLTGPTSDVSITIHGNYEALVRGYNAIVTADVSAIYQHKSVVDNFQQRFTKRQARRIIDELHRDNILKVEVFDRSAGTGIKTADMEAILQLVTDKLIELIFDAETGWAKEPERETAVEANQIQGRQQRGWFSRIFGGSHDANYYTDDQYVLKKRDDVRINTFILNLSKSTTIKVPVYASGNLGGLFAELGNDSRYFRIVDLNDPAFQRRDVHFQLDGDYIDSFYKLINFVTVNFRKNYGAENAAFTKELFFNQKEIKEGKTVQVISYPRLGIQSAEWIEYEYQLSWSLSGNEQMIRIPQNQNEWIRSTNSAISLTPPFQKRVIDIDADLALFRENEIETAVINFASIITGKPKMMEKVTIRVSDAQPSKQIVIYHDANEEVVYQVSWFSQKGKLKEELKILETDYLFLIPPAPESFLNNN